MVTRGGSAASPQLVITATETFFCGICALLNLQSPPATWFVYPCLCFVLFYKFCLFKCYIVYQGFVYPHLIKFICLFFICILFIFVFICVLFICFCLPEFCLSVFCLSVFCFSVFCLSVLCLSVFCLSVFCLPVFCLPVLFKLFNTKDEA